MKALATNNADKKVRFPFGRKNDAGADFYKAVPLNEDGNPDEVSDIDKAKGVAQMAAGTVITAAGIPMLILPGPGVAAIVGGAALTLKGHRTMTGREPLPIEQSIDETAERLVSVAKDEAAAAGQKVARKASDVGAEIADQGPSVVADAVKQAPAAVASVVSHAPEMASTIASQAPGAAEAVGRAVSRGSRIVVGAGAEVIRQGSQILKNYNEANK